MRITHKKSSMTKTFHHGTKFSRGNSVIFAPQKTIAAVLCARVKQHKGRVGFFIRAPHCAAAAPQQQQGTKERAITKERRAREKKGELKQYSRADRRAVHVICSGTVHLHCRCCHALFSRGTMNANSYSAGFDECGRREEKFISRTLAVFADPEILFTMASSSSSARRANIETARKSAYKGSRELAAMPVMFEL